MTLLTVVTDLSLNVGMEVPDQVIGSPRREMQEAIALSKATADEIARRVDWGALQETATLTGDGTNKIHDLPATFSRIGTGIAVKSGGTVVRPLTRPEWGALTAVEGVPRYFLLEGTKIRFWPYLANAATATVEYQTAAWCSNGTASWTADDQTALFNEDVLKIGLIARWRRQKGMDFADFEAEYEAALDSIARFDDRSRI